MKNLTHKQDRNLNRELIANLRKNTLFLFSVISLLLNPILLRAEDWWLPQVGFVVSETNPGEEYPKDNAVADYTAAQIPGENTPPDSPIRRVHYDVLPTQPLEVPFDDILDPDPQDILYYSFTVNGNVFYGFDPITKILTVDVSQLNPGETAEVLGHVRSRRPFHEEYNDAGFYRTVEIEALP